MGDAVFTIPEEELSRKVRLALLVDGVKKAVQRRLEPGGLVCGHAVAGVLEDDKDRAGDAPTVIAVMPMSSTVTSVGTWMEASRSRTS